MTVEELGLSSTASTAFDEMAGHDCTLQSLTL